jgi:hypothetical protein
MNDFLLEPWPLRGTKADEPTPTITRAIADAADRVVAERVVKVIVRENRMSLAGKMAALTERATKFNTDTEAVLDGIAAKVSAAETKRDAAKDRHHAYYDTIIKGVDDSVAVIDRLSNGPLPDDGKS